MIRLFLIAFAAMLSFIAFLTIFHRFLGLEDDLAGYLSMFLGLIITPILLLKYWKEKPDPNVMPIDVNDPIVCEQIKQSNLEMPRFLQALDQGKMQAFIKFPFLFGNEVEHVWGLAHCEKNKAIIASLESTPMGYVDENINERMTIKIEDIEDWMLVDKNDQVYGGYSVLALAKIYTRDYGKLPNKYARDLERFIDFTWPCDS